MEKSKTAYIQAEEEAAAVTPELFVEYSQADEEGQADMLVSIDVFLYCYV
jgi:kinetochore protein Spc7/SPC105